MLDVIRHEDKLCMCGHTRRAHGAAGCSGTKTETRSADDEWREERCECEEFQPAVVPGNWNWTQVDDAGRH